MNDLRELNTVGEGDEEEDEEDEEEVDVDEGNKEADGVLVGLLPVGERENGVAVVGDAGR